MENMGKSLLEILDFTMGGDDTDGNETYTSYEYMIEKVYREASDARYWDLDEKDLLWEYSENEEIKEMTIKEIEDKLGYKIKIVG